MLRLSSYAVLSARMKKGGYALLSGLAGSIDILNEELYNVLYQKTRDADPHEIYFADDELPDDIRESWLSRSFLMQCPHEDEKKTLQAVAEALHNFESTFPHIIIVPDVDCNYRCAYCFENDLHNCSLTASAGKTAMDEDEVEWVFRAADQVNVTSTAAKQITLFGGEPLNKDNKDIVDQIVKKGVSKGYHFAAVTNGHDLDAFLPLLGKNAISWIQVTIDGPRHIHDRRRIPLDGSSSYETVTANIRKALAETDISVKIRVNLDDGNLDAFGELLEAFDGEGWMGGDRVSVNAAIVYAKDKDGVAAPRRDISSMQNKLRPYTEKYTNVTIGCPQSNAEGYIFSALVSERPFMLRSSYCGSASGMYIFQPGGKINSCWESVGKECSEIGRYSADGFDIYPTPAIEWFGRSVAEIPECLDCKYCLLCAGGCPQYAQYKYKTLYKPFCDDFDKTYAQVLADSVEQYLSAQGL